MSKAATLTRAESLELARSSRFGRALTVLVFQTGAGEGRRRRDRRHEATMSELASVLAQRIRLYDQLVVDRPSGRIVVVAPETSPPQARQLQRRLASSLPPGHQELVLGRATFTPGAPPPVSLVEQAATQLLPLETVLAGAPMTGEGGR